MAKVYLTEEDITKIISEAVENSIDSVNTESILMGIAEQISNMGEIQCVIGENELYGAISFGGYDIDIDYTVESDSYYDDDDPGDYLTAPAHGRLIDGETRVFVNKIWVSSDSADDVIDVEDNGIVANALKGVIDIDPDSYKSVDDFADDDFDDESYYNRKYGREY